MTLISAVIKLKASKPTTISTALGSAVHGFWFHHWSNVHSKTGDLLHSQPYRQNPPYTLSPLINLPQPQNGIIQIPAGYETWFRVTTFSTDISELLLDKWLPDLRTGTKISIPRSNNRPENANWIIQEWTIDSSKHPWAGQTNYDQLTQQYLSEPNPSSRWKFEFLTPTAFHGAAGHLPFPLPDSLVSSWLRRWQKYAPHPLSKNLPERARDGIVVSGYNLRTLPMQETNRVIIGCVGKITLLALKQPADFRGMMDLLSNYAFYVGSGHRTGQGLGCTRLLKNNKNRERGGDRPL